LRERYVALNGWRIAIEQMEILMLVGRLHVPCSVAQAYKDGESSARQSKFLQLILS
jgi:hypothetical protein